MSLVPAVPRRSDWLVGQLPVGMLDDSFFYRFASIFQEEAASYIDGLDNLEHVVDPALAPPGMVRFLASWLALPSLDASLDDLYQRRLVKAAAELRWWRGTRRGLMGLLELLTGGAVEVVDNGGIFGQGGALECSPRVRVRVESSGWLSDADLLEVVRDEVPANVSLELFVGERQLWPSQGTPEGWGRCP